MNTRKIFGYGLLAIIIALAFAACDEGGGGSRLDLEGEVTVTPGGPVAIGTKLTASYDGSEEVRYQWYKGGVYISGANSSEFTPSTAGSYTAMASASGYRGKTSNAVTVTSGDSSTKTLVSISAAYNATHTVYTTTPIASLKNGLTVTAKYGDDTTATIAAANYTLTEIALTTGQNTITVSYTEGEITKTTTFTVNAQEPVEYAISLSPVTFPAADYGYGEQNAQAVIVTNIGTKASGVLAVAITGQDFTLTNTPISSLPADDEGFFNVTPKTGLNVGAHAATITVSNSGNGISETLNVSFTVNKADPSVTWPTGLTATHGQTLSAVSLPGNGSSAPAGAFTWTTPSDSVGEIGTQSHNMTFTPTDTANYHTLTQNVTITVNEKTNPEVTTWPTAAAITYGAALSTSALSGGVGEGAFAWTNGAIIPTVTNSGYSVTFTPTNTELYNTLTQNVSITVNKANPNVTWPTGLTAYAGQTLSAVSLPGNGTSTPAGAFTWKTPTDPVGAAGAQSHDMIFTPTDTANYNTLTQNVSIAVGDLTVTFDGNGGAWGSDTAKTVPVAHGSAVSQIEVPVGEGWTATAEGLYIGTGDRYVLTGWRRQGDSVNWNFSTPITANTTLLAQWGTPVPLDISATAGANNYLKAVNYINSNAGEYTLFINANISTTGATLSSASTLTLRGIGQTRTISLSANGALLTINNSGAKAILGSNITLQGRASNNNSVVSVTSGELVMREGAAITGNTSSNYGGGVYIATYGTFRMEGGTISGNSTINYGGGGVYNLGTFIMEGGTISGNTASSQGGGVYNRGTFRIVNGTIYGSNEADTSLRNTATSNGAALSSSGTAQRGTFSGTNGAWVSKGTVANSENTIRVANGEIVP